MTTQSSLELTRASPGQAAIARTSRLFFIDHWRASLAILVVLHHVALVYGASVQGFYYIEPPFRSPGVINLPAYLALLVFVLFNQAWFMGAFFLLAGYFAPGSVDRKGPGSFLTGRLVRLGIPILLFYFVLNPLSRIGWWLMPTSLTGITTPISWQAYPRMLGLGPLWFAAMLLVFSFGHALWRVLTGNRTPSSTSSPSGLSYLGVGVFVVVLAATSYLVRMIIPLGKSVSEFPTLAYLPQYLSFFVLGIVASRHDWFRTLPGSMGLVGLLTAAAASVLLFPLAFSGRLFSLELGPAVGNAWGNGHWQSAVYALWDSILAVGMCLGAITLFRRFLNEESRFGRFLSQQSYAVYVIHIPIVVGIAFALSGVQLAPLVKFGLASAIIVPICFIVAYMIRKIPFVSGPVHARSARETDDQDSFLVRKSSSNGSAFPTTAVAVHRLHKSYGSMAAVKDLSFSVAPGEILGVIGPNGAGKSSTIKMILDFMKPDSGEIEIYGHQMTEATKDRIGYLPEEKGLYKKLSAIDQILYLASLKGMDRALAQERAQALLHPTGMFPSRKKKVKEMSKGMGQMIQLIVTIVHDPDLVLLDEPFSGLDPVNTERVKSVVGELRDQGKAVILSTHQMNQVEELCDRVLMIDHGRAVLYGSMQDIRTRFRKKTLTVAVDGALPDIPGVIDTRPTRDAIELVLAPDVTPQMVLDRLRERGAAINRFEITTPTLHDIFIKLAGETHEQDLSDL